MKSPAPEAVVSYSGSAVAIGGALTLERFGVIVGIATALLTLAVNFYFQWRRDRREERELQARLAKKGTP